MTQLSHLQASLKYYKSKRIHQNREMRAKKKSAQLHAETLKFEEEKKFKSPRLKILMKFDIPQ